MGYPTQYTEWVELYNDGNEQVNLSGWTLYAEGEKKLSVPLSGVIGAKAYFLIEKNSSSPVQGVTVDILYSSAYLSNTGETLVLKNASNAEIQKISNTSGWEKGDSATKETMQWNDAGWITASATPKMVNATADVSASNKADETDKEIETAVAQTSSVVDISAHISPLPLSDFKEKQQFYISAGRDRFVAVGNLVPFEAYAIDAKGAKLSGLSAIWTFGDGSYAGGSKVFHAYKNVGDYVVILNGSTGGSEAVSRAEIRVFEPKIKLAVSDFGVSFENDSSFELNIGGWKLLTDNASFLFPEDTIIKQGKEILFSGETTNITLARGNTVRLADPSGKVVVSAVMVREDGVSRGIVPSTPVATTTASVVVSHGGPSSEVLGTAITSQRPVQQKTNVAAVLSASVSQSQKTSLQSTATSSIQNVIKIKKQEGFFSQILRFFGV